MSIVQPLRAVCRVCSYAWVGNYECERTPMGDIPPTNVICPKCTSAAGDFGDGGTHVGAQS